MAPQVSPDFSEAFTPLEPGTYRAKIVSCQEKTGKESGNPYLNWKLEINSLDKRFDGQVVYYSTPYVGRGAGIFKHFIRSARFPSYDGGPVNTDELINCFVSVKVERSGDYMRVAEVSPADKESFDASEEDFNRF